MCYSVTHTYLTTLVKSFVHLRNYLMALKFSEPPIDFLSFANRLHFIM